MATQRVVLLQRLEAYSAVNPATGCREWQRSKRRDGYGQLSWNGRPHAVHRLSWIGNVGDIPAGMGVLHHCDNPACINPEHLFLGTQADNMRDKRIKGRAHSLKGEMCGRAKLNAKEVAEIRASSDGPCALGRLFGVHHTTITNIRRGISW